MSRQTIDGLPVINARSPLTLIIEDCDIKGATPKDPSNCAAARAIKRLFHVDEVRVHATRTFVRYGTSHVERLGTPRILRDEAMIFDRGGEAFQGDSRVVTLPVLAPSKRATGERQGGPDKPRTGRMRRPRRVLTNVRPHA